MSSDEDAFKYTNILVVDDVSFYYSLIRDHLQLLGHMGKLLKANDVPEAISELKKHRGTDSEIGLIISDLNMPNHSGLDFIKTIRGSKNFKNIPFILFTSESESPEIIEAIQAGANGYLIKPWESADLREKLNSSL
ncbi:MAG: response regulator [Bacteriovoracaceae bacterium]|nr:response regulator [Bacteriovoracaceae bacterium]